jgi:hypothetical protein
VKLAVSEHYGTAVIPAMFVFGAALALFLDGRIQGILDRDHLYKEQPIK